MARSQKENKTVQVFGTGVMHPQVIDTQTSWGNENNSIIAGVVQRFTQFGYGS